MKEHAYSPFIIVLPINSSPADLDVHLADLDADLIRSSKEVIFRVAPSFVPVISGKQSRPARESAVARVRDKNLFILTYSNEEHSHSIFNLRPEKIIRLPDNDPLLSIARNEDLTSVIFRNEKFCLIKATDRYHFITPSRRHCSVFLRVGDCIRTARDMDCLSFWLLPHIATADAVLVDSPTILAPVMRSLNILKRELPVESLPIHPRYDKIAASRTLEAFSASCGAHRRILSIISVSSSGFLANFIKQILSPGREENTLQILSLFAFANSPTALSTLCKLDVPAENYSAEICKLCSHSKAISVDPSVYYVREGAETGLVLKPKHFQQGRAFFDEFSEMPGALRVHHSDPNDSRHHAFNLDVKTLLDSERFKTICAEHIHRVQPKPDLVIIPNHPAGYLLKKVAAESLNVPVIIANDLAPSHMSAAEALRIREAHNILIVDDVLNSGSRLLKFNSTLRENYAPFASINFFVGVARPQSSVELQEIRTALTVNHPWQGTVSYPYLIYLPRWKEDECPWCDEYAWLSRVSRYFANPPLWLSARISTLVESEFKLAKDPLFMLPDVLPRTLGEGSRTAPAGSSAIRMIFSFASALQEIRANEATKLDDRFPLYVTFGAKNLRNYSEALLHAVLLRTIRPLEWGIEQRELAAKLLKDFAQDPDQEGFLGELLLGMHRDAIPLMGVHAFEKIYAFRLGRHRDVFAKSLGLAL